MIISSISGMCNSGVSKACPNNSKSFGAKVFISSNVKPYLDRQMNNILLKDGYASAAQWYCDTWDNILPVFFI